MGRNIVTVTALNKTAFHTRENEREPKDTGKGVGQREARRS